MFVGITTARREGFSGNNTLVNAHALVKAHALVMTFCDESTFP